VGDQQRRIAVLDGVRGLAIGLVVAFHVGIVVRGAIGVTIFFVLSGFLITRLLLRPRALTGRELRDFYVRRALGLFRRLSRCACSASSGLSWCSTARPEDSFSPRSRAA